MIRARFIELAAGLRNLPTQAGWLRVAVEIGWALPLMLVIAHFGGLLRLQMPSDASTALGLAATLLLAPALGEEVLFRGLLIPRDGPKAKWVALSALLFVLWHPLQALTFGPPWASAFLDPWFLAAAAILGVALARIYAATRSLWPCVFAHWLAVFGWKAFLGGPI